MGDPDEVLVVLLAQAGDRSALDQLFRRYQERLYERVRSITGDGEVAADVLQDVFIVLQRKLGHLRDPRFFAAWATRIAVREAVRQAKKARRWEEIDLDLFTVPDTAVLNPLETLAAAEIAEHLTILPPASRAVLVLHYLDDLSIAEVAEALRIPVGTVKSRLGYGLARLRERLRHAPRRPSPSS